MKISESWDTRLKDKQNPKHYEKFYVHPCSSGLCEPPKKWLFYPGTAWYVMCNPMSYLRYQKNKNIARGQYDVYKKLGLKFPVYDEKHKWFYYNFNGESFNPNLSKYALLYHTFESVVGWDKVGTYCEIGSGYGGMVELLKMNTNIDRYVLIDLPEVLNIAKVYLKRFDGVEYVEAGNNLCHVNDIDMFMNSDSFVEMDISVCEAYFSFMQGFSGVYLLSFNRSHRSEGKHVYTSLPMDDKWEELFSIDVNAIKCLITNDEKLKIFKR